MSKKTDGVRVLVQDILATISEPYSQDITLEVFNKIENNREWIRRYEELSDDLKRGWVVNNAIGKYVKDQTHLRSLGKKSAKGKSNLITAYTQLG